MALSSIGSQPLGVALPRTSTGQQPITAEAALPAQPGEQFTPSSQATVQAAPPPRNLSTVARTLSYCLPQIPKEEWVAVGQLLGIAPGQGDSGDEYHVGQLLAAVSQGRSDLISDLRALPRSANWPDAVALVSDRRQAVRGFESHYQGLPLYLQSRSLAQQLQATEGQTVAALVHDHESGKYVELRGTAQKLEGEGRFSLEGRQLENKDLVMLAVLPDTAQTFTRSKPAPAPSAVPVASHPVSQTTLALLARRLPRDEALSLLEKAGPESSEIGPQNWAETQFLGWARQGDFDTANEIINGAWDHLKGKNTLESIPEIRRITQEFYAQPGINEAHELFPKDLRYAVGKRISLMRYHPQTRELEILYGTMSRAEGTRFGLREFPSEEFEQYRERLIVLDDQNGGPVKSEPMTFQVGSGQAQGHWSDDVDHRHYASSRYTIRTYAPVEGGKVASLDFRQLLQSQSLHSYPSQKYVITPEQVAESVKATGDHRLDQLQSLDRLQTGARVVPKDASLRATHYSLYVGEVNDPSGKFALQMAQIGQLEGFQVVAGVEDFKSALESVSNLSQMKVPNGEAWTEDVSEATLDGGQVIPAIFEDKEPQISAMVMAGRAQRFGQLEANLFGTHGMVNDAHLQEFGLARASLTGPARQALSYVEGGNMYTGTRADGKPYALVGKDSVYVSKALLERQTGREWGESEVMRTIAADLGLNPEEVFAIEQPGAFHLDLRLTSVAPGEIVLNDSRAAAEQQIAWGYEALEEQIQAGITAPGEAETRRFMLHHQARVLRERAEQLAPFEELAARDLEAAGLQVHRLGAAFVDPTDWNRDRANFFNARHGTNSQGQRYSILMGAEAHEEAFFAQKFLELSRGTVSRLHFLDAAVTAPTLAMYGGLKCRTKPEGQLVSPQELSQPNYSPLRQA